MKKILVAVLAMLMLLTGCSNANASLTNGKSKVMTVNGNSITNNDLYYMLMYSEYGSLDVIMNELENAIYEKVAPIDEEIEAKANEIVDNYKQTYGDYFDMIIAYSGYTDEEDFYNNSAIPNARYVKMVSEYIDLKFSTLSITNKPRKIQVAAFADEESANSALEAAKAGSSIADIIEEFGGESTYDGNEFVVTSSSSSLDEDVLYVVSATAVNGVIVSVLPGSDSKYYVVNMVECDPENFREEAIDAIANTVDLYEDTMRYFLKEYNFKISDTYTYSIFESQYPDYIFD